MAPTFVKTGRQDNIDQLSMSTKEKLLCLNYCRVRYIFFTKARQDLANMLALYGTSIEVIKVDQNLASGGHQLGGDHIHLFKTCYARLGSPQNKNKKDRKSTR